MKNIEINDEQVPLFIAIYFLVAGIVCAIITVLKLLGLI